MTWGEHVLTAMRRVLVLGAVALGSAATPVAAQDTYVSVSLTGDVVRFSASETPGLADILPGGEALGFALRVGTRLGAAWGVEAEFARAAEIESEGAPGVIPLESGSFTFSDTTRGIVMPGGGVTISPGSLIFPPISYRVRTAYRDLVFSAGAWARQDLSARVALVYSGGVGFHRAEHKVAFTFEPLGVFPTIPGIPILPRAPMVTEARTYSTRPFAGFEARVRMTDRLELVPGIRVHGLNGGILVRPSVGVGWIF